MESFDTTQQTVFALLRASLWGEERHPFSPLPETDWTAVFQELRAQTVDGLVTDLLVREDPGQKMTYLHTATRRISFWYTNMTVQQEMYRLLRAAGIPCVVLKGAAAAVYYPQPTYRIMGDIDMLVRPEDFDRAFGLLVEHGFQDLEKDDSRNALLKRDGVLIELHRYFSIFREEEASRFLDRAIWTGMDRAAAERLEGIEFPLLPPEVNGMVLLHHISQHMDQGLGLRQIVDWMLFADREVSDAWWEGTFRPLAGAIGLETLAVTVTRMCQLYLGLREDITWCRDAEPDLCRQLMTYLMEQGNFGYKAGAHRPKSVAVINSAKNPMMLLRNLHETGYYNWEAAQKHPWLKPFCAVYQTGRFVRKGLSRENPLQSLRKDMEAKQFFDRLGVMQNKLVGEYPGAQKPKQENEE